MSTREAIQHDQRLQSIARGAAVVAQRTCVIAKSGGELEHAANVSTIRVVHERASLAHAFIARRCAKPEGREAWIESCTVHALHVTPNGACV